MTLRDRPVFLQGVSLEQQCARAFGGGRLGIPTYQVLAHLPEYGSVIGQLLKSSALLQIVARLRRLLPGPDSHAAGTAR